MKKVIGIRRKILTITIAVIVIAFVIVTAVAYKSSKTSIVSKSDSLIAAQGEAAAKEIETWAAGNLATLENAIDTMINLKMTDEDVLGYESFYLETYADFPNGIYITKDNGKVLDATGWEPEGNALEGQWYTEGASHDSFAYGEPYLDSYTNEYIVTASRRFTMPDGRMGAIAAADVSLSILSNVVSEMEIVGGGDAFIVDAKSGTILAHKNPELQGVLCADAGDAYYQLIMACIESGQASAALKSAQGVYNTSINNISGTSWYVVSRALQSNILADVQRLGVILAGVGIGVVVVITIILVAFINRITGPIKRLTKSISDISSGDFTTEIQVSGNDEVTVMSLAMKEFVDSMRETLKSIADTSNLIDVRSQGSSEISTTLGRSAEGQTAAMNQLNNNLSELVESITMIAEDSTALAMNVAEADEKSVIAMDNIKTTMEAANEGRVSMSKVNDSMHELKASMSTLGESINNVGDAAAKIDAITATISEIAEETNLLSLNASIEAARAGEAGKGFAVVAMEIQKLAETSSASANQISELIESVTNLINETVNKSSESMEMISNGADLVSEASEQFNSIYESIEETSSIVNAMIAAIREVNEVTNNVAAVTEEQSASAEEIKSTAENVLELADSVNSDSASVMNDARTLANTAQDLKERLSAFRI